MVSMDEHSNIQKYIKINKHSKKKKEEEKKDGDAYEVEGDNDEVSRLGKTKIVKLKENRSGLMKKRRCIETYL